MRTKVLLSIVLITVIHLKVFSQYDGVEICLTKHSPVISENQRITLFYEESFDSYFAGIKNYPYINEKDISSFDSKNADTLFKMSKTDFNRIVEMCIGLSSLNVLSGMNMQGTAIIYEGSSISLMISANYESVRYDILLPIENVSERHLQQFVVLCEEILKITNLSAKRFLGIKTKRF
ncbi:MAG: hypothetical protein IKW82_08425 [Bacteroidales bacterium]|jgi:hypothetical protein|nr:hypothetical protein [Bacteroidales bacterium]